eukprot:Phypoly_transcript_03473.p1 GENE.Phypoly_transcript_03473~~Phypoly_transcript_03473.p1  ORF type:complete len:791 (+),score=112.50 Phypoly_transcript_03473:114-2375(+)
MASGATLVVTQLADLYTDYDDSTVKNLIINVTSTGTLQWQGSCEFVSSVLNNNGQWVTYFSFEFTWDSDDQSNPNMPHINNYGSMLLSNKSDSTLRIYGTNFTNYGTVLVGYGTILQIGYEFAYTTAPLSYFMNYGTFGVQGTFHVDSKSYTVFTESAKLWNGHNSGTILVEATGPGTATFAIDSSFPFTDGTIDIEPAGLVLGKGNATIGTLILACGGGIGPGNALVANAFATHDADACDTDMQTLITGTQVTVVNSANLNAICYSLDACDLNLYIEDGAKLILASTCKASALNLKMASDSQKGQFVNYGALVSGADPNDPKNAPNFVAAVPSSLGGTITVFESDPSYMTFYPQSFSGSIMSEADDDYYIVLTGPAVFTPTANFSGGQISFTSDIDTDGSFQKASDYPLQTFTFQERSVTTWDASLLLDYAVRIIVDSPQITISQLTMVCASIEGKYNLTAHTVLYPYPINDYSWQVNGTSLVIDKNLTISGTDVAFVDSGKVVVGPNAKFEIGVDGLDLTSDNANPDAGFYVYGDTTVLVDSDEMSTTLSGGSSGTPAYFNNFGDISLTVADADLSGPKGATLELFLDLVQQGSGSISLTAYSKSDFDVVSFFPNSEVCAFSGILNVDFKYSPKAGEMLEMVRSQGFVDEGAKSACSGQFTIKVNNLPGQFQAVLMYDFHEAGGYTNYIVVCDSSNTTCSQYQRDPNFINGGGSKPGHTTTDTGSLVTTHSAGHTEQLEFVLLFALILAVL